MLIFSQSYLLHQCIFLLISSSVYNTNQIFISVNHLFISTYSLLIIFSSVYNSNYQSSLHLCKLSIVCFISLGTFNSLRNSYAQYICFRGQKSFPDPLIYKLKELFNNRKYSCKVRMVNQSLMIKMKNSKVPIGKRKP